MLYHLLISALLTSTTVARALSPFVANEDQQTNQDITFLNNVPIQGSTDSDLTIDANNNGKQPFSRSHTLALITRKS